MTAPPSRRSRWLALLMAAAFFMENLDRTVITTALPAIARSVGVQPLDLGVAPGAVGVRLGQWIAARAGGEALPGLGFRMAFVLVAAASLVGLWDARKLADGAGAHVARRPAP
jgi:hypothetical protein